MSGKELLCSLGKLLPVTRSHDIVKRTGRLVGLGPIDYAVKKMKAATDSKKDDAIRSRV